MLYLDSAIFRRLFKTKLTLLWQFQISYAYVWARCNRDILNFIWHMHPCCVLVTQLSLLLWTVGKFFPVTWELQYVHSRDHQRQCEKVECERRQEQLLFETEFHVGISEEVNHSIYLFLTALSHSMPRCIVWCKKRIQDRRLACAVPFA